MSAHAEHHITPLWVYLAVGGTLLVLTGITVAAALVDFNALLGIPWLNILIAMLIATVKASFVVLIFMHLLYDKKINLAVFITSIFFFGIFVVLTMADIRTRGQIDPVTGPAIRSAIIYDDDGKLLNPKNLEEHHEDSKEHTDEEPPAAH